MAAKRKVHTSGFKVQVDLAVLKGDKTINELAGRCRRPSDADSRQEKQLTAEAESLFGILAKAALTILKCEAELFEQIGRLKMELEWMKKKSPTSCEHMSAIFEPDHPALSVRRQCELLAGSPPRQPT